MRILGVVLGLAVLLAVVQTINSFDPTRTVVQHKTVYVPHAAMTAAACRSLYQGEPEGLVTAKYGTSDGAGPQGDLSIGVDYQYDVDWYPTIDNRECDVYFGPHQRVRMVFLELLPNG